MAKKPLAERAALWLSVATIRAVTHSITARCQAHAGPWRRDVQPKVDGSSALLGSPSSEGADEQRNR